MTFAGKTYAQQAITITWDSETGCLVYDDKREKFVEEEIVDGDCVRVCEGSTVTYTLTGNSSTWTNTTWNVSGGTVVSSNITQCVVDWGSAGWGSVSATVTDGTQVYEEEVCIEIITSPEALFGLMPDTSKQIVEVCLEDVHEFVNLSNTNGGTALMSYYWDFGDGTTSSEFEPSHQYMNTGGYEVTLTVTNLCNCTSTYSMKVEVVEGGFEIECPSVVCEGEVATYSVPDYIAEKCHAFNWHIIGGNFSPSSNPNGPTIDVVWDNVDDSGFGYIIFDGSDCEIPCKGPFTIKVPVVKNNGFIDGETVVCTNGQYVYKLPQWPSTDFNWTLASGSTGATIIENQNRNEIVLQTDSNAGTVVLNATYTNTLLNCGGTATLTISIRPRVEISGPDAVCLNSNEVYNLPAGYSGNWVLTGPGGTVTGSGNSFSNTFNTLGQYSLSVTGSTFCEPEAYKITVVDKEPAPDAIIGPDEACAGTPIDYFVLNTVPGTVIGWEVVNGTINGSSYGDAISVTFTGPGPYIVRAWRESKKEPNCPSNKISKTVTAPNITLNIDGSNVVCASSYENYEVDFTDGDTYTWSVDPATVGSVSSGQGTTQAEILWNQFNYPGAKVIVAVEKCGQTYTQEFLVDVLTTPSVSFVSAPAQICAGNTANFQLSSGLTSGTITWNFGDGSPEVTTYAPGGLSVSHNYSNTGGPSVSHTVTATIDGPNGCLTPLVLNHTINVIPAPVASITPAGRYKICPESSLNETVTVNIQGGLSGITSIEWFRNGTSIQGPNMDPDIVVTSYGSYYAVVTGPAPDYCTTTTNTVRYEGNCGGNPCTITPTPTVSVSAVNNCGTITATGSASPTPDDITWITPSIPDSQTTNNTTGTFVYSEAGQYTIYYRATYGSCTTTRSTTVTVPYIPELRYSVTCGSTPGTYDVTLLDNSNYFPSTPITSWDFYVNGNQQGSGTSNSETVTLAPGTYTLDLTIQGSGYPACSTPSVSLVLPNMPDANFTHDAPRCEDAVISFHPTTINPDYTYAWELEPGVPNLQVEPERVYNPDSTYPVTLTVTNQYGCSSTVTQNITVTPNNLQGVLSGGTSACEGSTITLTYTNTGSITPQTLKWMRGSTLVATTTFPSVTYTATAGGSYWVKVESANGCTYETDRETVTFIKPPAANIDGPDEVCLYEEYTLTTDQGDPTTEYRWYRNGTLQPGYNNQVSITETQSVTGTYTYEVVAQIPDGNGGYCTNSDTHTVTINPLPLPPSITRTLISCDPYVFKLEATASAPGTFTWSNGMDGNIIYVNQGGPYQVRYTNESGCSSTRNIDVPYDPAIHFWTVPTGCYSICEQFLQDASILSGPNTPYEKWVWYRNGNDIMSGSNSLVAPVNLGTYGSGTYSLVLDNGYCDKESGDVNIEISERCRECRFKVEVKDIKPIYDDKKGYCYYAVDFFIDNPFPFPIQITITAPNGDGIFIPSSITAAPGGNVYSVIMIPTGSAGGSVEILFETTIEGKYCFLMRKYDFPDCPNRGKRLAVEEGGKEVNLLLSPNPAQGKVDVHYDFASSLDGDSRTIEIYSLMGVLMNSQELKNVKGSWSAELSRFPAGQYIVIMKLNGSVLTQQALIVE
ncbi:hypothetical protein GCM10007424_26250 [Flavobacterium suaedae]|uniref:PKD domain-containing protein n=2 Tax=Flavobacterium suaedae TaxID=1767027 RepID=A0ABQ1K3A4_9FLAO|nr:hypothetical protein GCM10007424_26250 [Flavobacterium suaedae]